MDIGQFASIAQIRILLVPVGSIRRSAFEKYSGLVRSFEHIRLGDIPPDTREDKNRFLPSPLASGNLHLSFLTHPPPTWRSAFNLFRISSFPLAVIGIADCTSGATASSLVAEFKADLSTLLPDGLPFPFTTKCLAFEEGEGNANMNLSTSTSELVTIPSLMGNKQVYVGTLLAELCHDIIVEFPSIVRCIDTPHGLDTLNSEILPRLGRIGGVYYLHRSAENPVEPVRNGGQRSGTPSSNPAADRVTSGMASSPTKLSVPPAAKKRNSAGGYNSGRLAKTLGDLYLLSGKLSDASYWYTEAVSLFRAAQDTIWNASALEGQCIVEVLEAWNMGESLHASLGGNVLADPWANISDKMGQAINLYSRAAPTNPSPANTIFPLDNEHSSIVFLYISAVLRYSHLLLCIWSSKGWNPLSVSSAFSTTLPPTFSPDKPSIGTLYRMSALSNITRSFIGQVVAQCHGPFLLHLQPSDIIFVFSVMAKYYSGLGFRRKEAYVLRELQAALVDLIVLGREESRSDVSEVMSGYTRSLEINPDDPTLPFSQPGSVARRDQDNEEGNTSVLRITQHIAAVYGIDLQAVKLVDGLEIDADHSTDAMQPSHLDPRNVVQYGWPELQVGVVREATAVTEALPDHASKAQFSLSTIKQLHQHLTASEQQHLHDSAARGLNTVRRRGGRQRIEFWPDNLIIRLDVIPLTPHKHPIEQSWKRLETSTSASTAKGPFIYEPKGKKASTAHVAVQNEALEFEVLLRNPYHFDLEVQSIFLSTTGLEFQTQPHPTVAPADSEIVVVLSGIPLETGTLTIRGCFLQLPGGAPKEMLVPLPEDDDTRLSVQRLSGIDNDSDRIKYAGLESNHLVSSRGEMAYKSKRASQTPSLRFLQVQITPEQPLLRLRRSSIVHGSLMMFSGERSSIHLTVENISTLPVDFHRLTFEDSTIASAQQTLDEGDMSVAEAYEAEYELLRRPFLSWDPTEDRRVIAPGATLNLKVACYGKLNCTSGTIHLSYAYADRHQSNETSPESSSSLSDIFHLRQIQYPVNVTVYHTLECNNLDIIPHHTFQALPPLDGDISEEGPGRRELMEVGEPGEYCLVFVDVSNVFGMPFNATLTRHQADTPDASITRVVSPGSTVRLFLPVKRFVLSSQDCTAPIPALTNRQFVVSKEKLSQEEERLQRELFWYREELFKMIEATWTEDATHRSGIISLRSQRLTLLMYESLRRDCIIIETGFETMHTEAGTAETSLTDTEKTRLTSSLPFRGRNSWRVELCEMVHLVIRVRNELDRPCRLSLTCRPVHPTPSEHAIFDGWLSNNLLGVLQPGDSTTKTFAVVFVAEGTFNFRVDVEELDLKEGTPLRELGRYPAMSSRFVTAIVEEGSR
ncbi:TRAPP II complex [Cantharellus anzutake]|uniref:TRAPP II complex n=1 Tax=Cantharellus anzutake TaxID=1750568 RepID=UPI0019044ED8|nr:TRAPP II complex [Cantharellus anzutake]KAF8334324.1 TRAPP II complex [Cantharellus anzutake]